MDLTAGPKMFTCRHIINLTNVNTEHKKNITISSHYYKNKQNLNPACACHIYLLRSIILFYLFIFKLCIKANLADVFSLDVNSQMSKFSSCTRPGRLSTTKTIAKRTVGIIYPCIEKKFIEINPQVDNNFAVRNFTGDINVAHP